MLKIKTSTEDGNTKVAHPNEIIIDDPVDLNKYAQIGIRYALRISIYDVNDYEVDKALKIYTDVRDRMKLEESNSKAKKYAK